MLWLHSHTWLVKHANKIHAYDRESSVSVWGGLLFFVYMFLACMRHKRKEAKYLGEEKQHRHSGACTTKIHKSTRNDTLHVQNVSLTVPKPRPRSKLEKETKTRNTVRFFFSVRSRHKSLEEMQQIKSSICYYVGLQWHVQVCSGSPPFLQVIPVCLFLAHDQNYDAIFRSQYEEGEKKKHSQKASLRNVT